MKFIGHAWVAMNAVPRGNRKLLILGSVLPEIMYYTKSHPFEFEEIHEGGDRVYKYLVKNNSDWSDLGLGMAAHSVELGADHFNMDENLQILGYEGERVEKLRKRLMEVLGVDHETSKIRAHNILELGVELGIVRKEREFVDEFKGVMTNSELRVPVAQALTGCFGKDLDEVQHCVNELLDKARSEYFEDARGLAMFWAELSKEFDPKPDIDGLAGLLTELSEGYSGKDEEFLNEAIKWTKGNLDKLAD
jgi:hypothetical protein